jgi:DNA polymerase/3'-5' exonuclease PolX
LSEYELSDIKTKKKVKVTSEEDIFKKLGMDYIKPEFR